ncbi:MAG: PKD domain-containing protein [Vicinamibacterales bacterium]
MTVRMAWTMTFVVVAATMAACDGSRSPTRPTPPPLPTTPTPVVLPVAMPAVLSASQDPIAAVSAVQFDASSSTSSASGGITSYLWNFGDGLLSSGAQVQHVFMTSGTKTVTLTVTDANGTSVPAATSVTIKDLTGTWQAQFNVQTRTYTLVQSGSVITGIYTNTLLLRQEWPVNGSLDMSRRFTITATYPGETTVVLSNAVVDASVSSFTGMTFGGSADGQMLIYRRVQ